MTGQQESMNTYHPFKHDVKRHKDFKCAARHLLKESKHEKSNQALTLSKEEGDLLGKGLAPFDMDDRWEGNLADSKANADAKEVVVRLYRTWTSFLIFEARYRPRVEDKEGTLSLYEFAFESDKERYLSSDLQHEIGQYQGTLKHLLATITSRVDQGNGKNSQ